MPLWLDLLRTPMAAPETRELRRLRRTWQVLCLTLAGSIAALEPLTRAGGRAVPCAIAALLFATITWSAIYLTRKARADAAFLDQGAEDQPCDS